MKKPNSILAIAAASFASVIAKTEASTPHCSYMDLLNRFISENKAAPILRENSLDACLIC